MKKKKTISNKRNIGSSVKIQELKSDEIRKLKRELKIEAALEKVRARGMAMKISDELGLLIGTLFKELTKLDLALTRCVIWIIDPKTNDAVWWMANSEDPSHPMSYIIPYHKAPPWLAFIGQWKKRTKKWVYDLKGQTKKKWDDHLFSKTGLSKMPKFIQKGMRAPYRVLLSASFNNFGGMNVASLEPLSDEHFNILLRFAKVFDQTYTRFLDLQKAEAQAREAQIEAALERVRAKAMAMHNSKDISTTAGTVLSELKKLDINPQGFAVGLLEKGSRKAQSYSFLSSAAGDSLALVGWIILSGHPVLEKFYECLQKGEDYFPELHGNQYKSYYQSIAPGLSLKPISQSELKRKHFGHFFPISIGYLIAWSDNPYKESEIKIIKRFASIIDLTFRRFLDLQKAEAQAREAQIEVALEKIRSRSLAMHHSKELKEVVLVVLQKIQELGVSMGNRSAAIFTFEAGNKDYYQWAASPSFTQAFDFLTPYIDHPVQNNVWNAREKGTDFYTKSYTTEQKNSFFRYLFKRTVLKDMPEADKKKALAYKSYDVALAFEKNSAVAIVSHSGYLLTEDENTILKRVARVFEQAYIRFLDLQKAEAQAREAQIEAALERVRSRSMAMHQSAELLSVIEKIYAEIQQLGLDALAADLMIFTEDKKGYDIWVSGTAGTEGPYRTSELMNKHPYHINTVKAWINGENVRVAELKGKLFKRYCQIVINDLPGLKALSGKAKNISSVFKYERIIHTEVFTRHGCIRVASLENRSEIQLDIQKRFAKVFDQCYTRFLDLQKAEAQAREAQIEAALERVRSRTMAIQRSEELDAVIKTVYAELKQLDVSFVRCFIMIFDEQKGATWWMGGPDGDLFHQGFYVPYHTHPPHLAYLNGWEKRQQKWEYLLAGKIKKNWDEFIFTKTELSKLPPVVIQYMRSFEFAQLTATFEDFGCLTIGGGEKISDESFDILIRFAKVFDQTYTRFKDLKKAEAQAREAQIQLALERVRARTMAMHKSDELAEVATVLFEQMSSLDNTPERFNIRIVDEAERAFQFWATDQEGHLVNKFFRAEFDKSSVVLKMYTSWKAKEEILIQDLHGDQLSEWVLYIKDVLGVPFNIEHLKEHRFLTSIFFSHGMIGITTNDPPGQATLNLIKRFAKVFEQTYTRFLDLQKAEAQAREAQIQLALERVRARTMAMHKSDELPETSHILFEQMNELGEPAEQLSIGIVREELNVIEISATLHGDTLKKVYSHSIDEPYMMNKVYKAWKSHQKTLVVELRGQELNAYNQYRNELTHSEMFPTNLGDENRRIVYAAFFSKGMLALGTNESRPPQSLQLLERFASVFDLTYTRFLDLQKAEAQAREARIEMALERIRARALAMHSSNELIEVTKVMREQMTLLGQPELESTVVHLYEQDTDHVLSWRTFRLDTDTKNEILHGHMSIPKNSHAFVTEWLDNFYSNKPEYTIELSGTKQDEWYKILFTLAPDVVTSMQKDHSIHEKRYYHFAKFSGGALLMISKQQPAEESKYLLRRAAAVFDLAYRRFTDLQKAEAQAREAQIETSLERVRSTTMAMHKSEDALEVIRTLGEQLLALGFDIDVANFNCDYRSRDWNIWLWTVSTVYPGIVRIPYIDHPYFNKVIEAMNKGQDAVCIVFNKQEKDSFQKHFYQSVKSLASTERRNELINAEGFSTCVVFSKNTSVTIGKYTTRAFTNEQTAILKRFATAFEQAYTRFLDLQKAEAQAREAQIEAALERVRAKAMAMHKSEDINPAVAIVFEEMEKLNLGTLRCGIGILDKEKRTGDVWTTAKSDQGNILQVSGDESLDIHPLLQGAFEAWLKQDDFSYVLQGEDMVRYYRALTKTNFQLQESQLVLSADEEEKQYYYVTPFHAGTLFAFRETAFPDEAKSVMKRFANVFNLTYKRFLDLQKAEAQAREAQIEAALERVRAKAMSMHNSTDLSSTVNVFFKELKILGVNPMRCGVGEVHEETRSSELVFTTSDKQGELYELPGILRHEGHPIVENIYKNWKKQEEYHPVLQGNEMIAYYKVIKSQMLLPDFPEYTRHYGNYFYFREGYFFAWGNEEFTEEGLNICRRFTSALSLTYKRYKDLKKAEAQAREAQIELSLERIRAQAMAMNQSSDLLDIVVTMRNEFTSLGHEAHYFWHMRWLPDKYEKAMTSGDGTRIGMVMELPRHMHGDIPLLAEWEKGNKPTVVYAMDADAAVDYVDKMIRLGDFKQVDPNAPNADDIRHIGGLTFVIARTTHGEIGYSLPGVVTDPPKEDLITLKRFTDVFDLAYRRFEDLQKAEAQALQAEKDLIEIKAARKKAEETLADLQATQKQLIQSEKMASLGELTAGIAHEIQNPLNFVNNFSEVSNELIDEMNAEIEKGDLEEAKTIAGDVKQNLEKINFHGKRADAIVKSMLQHSRSSSGKKEMIDINALADEYLRLAYHGLRAKDKSFNAKFETDFDTSIEKVNVVPQEMGRVILNLINNAFYAVTEKKNQQHEKYEPTVRVSTKQSNGIVEIKVADNGNGIPQKVLDKIFQPFFTTKPTGSGTGLGLSLSYDIITKGHNGELKVETKEGEGTEFIILLSNT